MICYFAHQVEVFGEYRFLHFVGAVLVIVIEPCSFVVLVNDMLFAKLFLAEMAGQHGLPPFRNEHPVRVNPNGIDYFGNLYRLEVLKEQVPRSVLIPIDKHNRVILASVAPTPSMMPVEVLYLLFLLHLTTH